MADKEAKKTSQSTGLWDRIKGFFVGVSNETKRIRWPKFSELMSSTGKVLVFCVLFAIFFVLCDLLVSELLVLLGVGA